MPAQACPNVVNDCRCDDWPLENLTSEGSDLPTFLGIVTRRQRPDLGDETFIGFGCLGWFFSTISQADADEQALADCDGTVVTPEPDPDPDPPPDPPVDEICSAWTTFGNPETIDTAVECQYGFDITVGAACHLDNGMGGFCDTFRRWFAAYATVGPYATDQQITIQGTGIFSSNHASRTSITCVVGISQDPPTDIEPQCGGRWTDPVIPESQGAATNFGGIYGTGINLAWDTDFISGGPVTFLLPAGQSRYVWFGVSYRISNGGDPGCSLPSTGDVSGTIVVTVA